MRKLTPQQYLFLTEYKKDFNAQRALNIAYPKSLQWKDTTCDSTIYDLLHNPLIMDDLEKFKAETQKKEVKNFVLSKEKIIKEMINIYNDTRESGASERGYSLKAIELLAKAGKVLETGGNSVNVNIVNSNNMTEVSNYLRLSED